MRIKFKDIMEIVNIKKIIKEFPKIGKILALLPVDNIGSLSTELKLIIVLLVRVIKFEYKVQVTTFIYVLFAAVYICVPTDIIMDFIPVVGYIDDAALVSFLVKIIFDEIANFKKSVNIEEVNFFEEIKISKEVLEHFVKSDFFSEVKENFTTVLSNFEFESLNIENNNLVDQSAMLYEEYTKKGYQPRTEHLLDSVDDTEIQYVINNMMYYNDTGQIKTSVNQIEKQFIGKVDKTKILAAIDNYDKFLDNTWIDVTYKETVPMKTGNNNYILHYEVHKEKPKLFTSPKTNIVDFTDHILIEQKYSAIGELTKYHLYEVKNNINNLKRHGKVPNIKMIFIVNTKYGNLVIDYLSVNSEVRITASDARDLYFALDIEKILNRVINNKSI